MFLLNMSAPLKLLGKNPFNTWPLNLKFYV